MVQQMSTRSLNTLMQWCYINSLALNKPAKTIERLRASTLLIPWLTDSNQRLEATGKRQCRGQTNKMKNNEINDLEVVINKNNKKRLMSSAVGQSSLKYKPQVSNNSFMYSFVQRTATPCNSSTGV